MLTGNNKKNIAIVSTWGVIVLFTTALGGGTGLVKRAKHHKLEMYFG